MRCYGESAVCLYLVWDWLWAVFVMLLPGGLCGSNLFYRAVPAVRPCGHVLSAKELIPVVSWLMQKGHCRHCGAVISWRYPLVEVLTAGIFFSLAVCYTNWQQLLLLLCLSCLLVLIALVDYESWLIPDIFITVGIVLYLLLQMLAGAALQPLVLSSLLRGCSVAVPLLIFVMIGEKIWKKPVMAAEISNCSFCWGFIWGR